MYKINFYPSAIKNTRKFPKSDIEKIYEAIESLSIEPRPLGSEALKGRWKGYFRICVKDYRVMYEIDSNKNEIIIIRIGQRENFY